MENENQQIEKFDKNKEWREQANCLTADPEIFFPDEKLFGVENNRELTKSAKQKCVKCVAKLACYNFAVNTGQNDGIWGGMTEAQRRALRRRPGRIGETQLTKLIERDLLR